MLDRVSRRYLSLCGPETTEPLLLLPSSDSEEGVEDQDKTLVIDREEGHIGNPLAWRPAILLRSLYGGLAGLGQSANGEVVGSV